MKILFLDDMKDRHAQARQVFSSKEHTLTPSFTAPEAISSLEKEDFDLICLDSDLSEDYYSPFCGEEGQPLSKSGTGMDVVKWLTTHRQNSSKPLVVMIHTLDHEEAARMHETLMNAGFPVIRKSFDLW